MSSTHTAPPGPGRFDSLRRLAHFFDDPVSWYDDLRATYGDLVALRAGPLRMTVAFDPDLVERLLVRDADLVHKGDGLRTTRFVLGNGLITADGDIHRRHRKLAAPVFTPRNIQVFADATVDIALDAIASWPDGVVPLARDLYDISLRVAGVGLFGTDFDANEREHLHESMRVLNDGYRTLSTPGGARVTALRLTPGARRLHAARDHVDEVIRAVVAQRRLASDTEELRDLLSRLLAARDEDDGGSFTDEELRDEAVTMLLAGHDTTAATLGWCLAMLALHPDEQASARAEVDALLGFGADTRRVTADDLRALPRLRAVVDETMRLHPAVYSTVRDPIEPITLDGTEVVLEPGTDVVIPIAGIHRDPRLWTEPNAFRPQRFVDGDGVDRAHRVAFIPFGTGRRICIGSSFALQELVLVLATVLQHVELTAPDGFELRPHVGFIRRPAGELPLHVRRR